MSETKWKGHYDAWYRVLSYVFIVSHVIPYNIVVLWHCDIFVIDVMLLSSIKITYITDCFELFLMHDIYLFLVKQYIKEAFITQPQPH